jgi:hypothetical protein
VLGGQLGAPDRHVEARLDDLVRPFEVVARLRDHQGPRLRDHELALLEREVGVGLLDDLGLTLGPPFGDAGALDQGVLEDGVEVQEARVVVLPDVADIVLRLLGLRHVLLGPGHEMHRVLLAGELPDKARQHGEHEIAHLGQDDRGAALVGDERDLAVVELGQRLAHRLEVVFVVVPGVLDDRPDRGLIIGMVVGRAVARGVELLAQLRKDLRNRGSSDRSDRARRGGCARDLPSESASCQHEYEQDDDDPPRGARTGRSPSPSYSR